MISRLELIRVRTTIMRRLGAGRLCPSVALICSNGLRAQIPLLRYHLALQRVHETEWTHSPKS